MRTTAQNILKLLSTASNFHETDMRETARHDGLTTIEFADGSALDFKVWLKHKDNCLTVVDSRGAESVTIYPYGTNKPTVHE